VFKHIGLSMRTHPLDHKRYTAIAGKQTAFRPVDLSMLANADLATQQRLALGQDVETTSRLTQRLNDLAQIRAYFQTQTDVTFLGMYGWGEGCQVSAAPGQGISEYDAIIYEKNGRIVVEKIGSCWQLFQKKDRFSRPVSSGGITSGGDMFLMNTPVDAPSEFFFGEHRKTPVSFVMSPIVRSNERRSVVSSAVRQSSLDIPDEDVGNPILASRLDTQRLAVGVDVSEKTAITKSFPHKRRLKPQVMPPIGLYCMTADDPNFLKQMPSRVGGCRDSNCTDSACVPVRLNVAVTPDERTDPLVIDVKEGCPCCLNAVDLDELAGLGKILNNTGDEAAHMSFELATMDASWGLVAGIAGPFAMIGLVAAYRNVVGAYATRQVLVAKLAEMDSLILEEATPQRLAYRYCLQYSLFDTNWNIAVPGLLNGGSSSAVLSTLIVSSPLAIPALGAYAMSQAGRGLYDMARSWNHMTGHDKIDQITRSKRLFYMSNTTAFTCMGVGAALVAVSPLTFGATLVPGLCLLIPGTVSSGVLNNIWPRKFRPRNGDLGVSREQLRSQTCLTLIDKVREKKSIIKEFKKRHFQSSLWLKTRRVSAKLMAVLPFCESKAGRWLHALTQEQLLASGTQLTLHQSELFQALGMSESGGKTVADLLTTELKALRYSQYGLVDFYWGLRRFES